jgi:hypothetical protein
MSKDDILKDYITVNERILKFYELYPQGRINTELISWNDGIIIMKAYAYRDETNVISSTGHAFEKEGSSYINKTSALENCETSVVGRCLANLGLEIKRGVASREEVENAVSAQQILKDEKETPAPSSLKAKYQLGKGDLEGFEEWFETSKSRGYTISQLEEGITKKLMKEGKI